MQANRYKIEKFLKPNASLIAKYFHILMSLFSNKKKLGKKSTVLFAPKNILP